MADDLKVKMGVDVDGVLRGMQRAEKSLGDFKNQAARFKAALDKSTDPKSIERLNRAIEASVAKIKAIQSVGSGAGSGFNKVANGADTAGQSLQNLGRIAQDAPFGFIGIQNNINPLLESFGRLRKETGSAGSAFKALISSLAGGAGIGLAVSLATSALTVLTQQGFFKSKKGADEAAEANKEYIKSLKDIGREGVETGVKLQGYVNIAKDQTLSISQRNEALKQANKIFGEHGEKLTLLNVATAAVTEQINKFTQATIQQSLASKFAERAADLIIQQRDAAAKYGLELNKLNAQQERFNKTFASNSANAGEAAAARLQQGARALEDQKKNAIGAAEAYKRITSEVQNVSNQLSAAQLAATGLFGELGTKSKGKEKAVKDVETITDVIQELRKEISYLEAVEIGFGTNEAKAKISAIDSAAKKLVKDFNIDPKDAIINKMLFGGTIKNDIKGINIPGIEGLTQELQDRIKRSAPTTPVSLTIPILPKIEVKPIDNKEYVKVLRGLKIKEGVEALAIEMQNIIGNSLGDAIAAAVGGQNAGAIFGSFFKTILTALGNGVQEIGIQAAAVQKLLIGLKRLFGTPAGLGAAIGLIALGGIIKGLASRIEIPGFADGVTNFRGGTAIVGERGPELVRLPSGSDVVPNHSLGAIGGGQAIEVTGSIRAQGTELVVVFDRAMRSINRVG